MRGIFVQMPPNDKHYRTLESIWCPSHQNSLSFTHEEKP
jgi:hypothetical protein